jgi:hypothetical protein
MKIQRNWVALAIVLAGAGLVAGCGDEKPTSTGASMDAPASASAVRKGGVNTAPRLASVSLEPSHPQPGTLVQARAEASDADGDPVNVRFEWRADGRVIAGAHEGSLVVPQLRKGSELSVVAVASDGRAASEPATAKVRIDNQPPVVAKVRFEPAEAVKPGDIVIAVAEGDDPDGDELSFHYEWRVGDQVVGTDRERFDTAKLKRGDPLTVRVTASDGEDESAPVEGPNLVLGNSAPTIVSLPPATMNADGVFRYAVEVKDPDGDHNLRFRLAQAPEGAKVDPLLGEITWKPTVKQQGKHAIEVAVSDGHGGETSQAFEVEVKEVGGNAAAEAPPAKAAPAP